MDTKKEAKKYLNKYFKSQYLKETDDEYKSLVRLLNKALRIHDVVGRSEQLKAFADYAQKRMWGDGDKDLSEFVDEFLCL